MRTIFFLLSAFVSYSVSAQVARLDIDNPAPRAGDDIRVTFVLEKQGVKSETAAKNRAGFGDIKITTALADTGRMAIGPFRFTIRTQEYQTDSLIIRVYPQLPSTAKDGVWLRQIDFNGDHFLIIEQRVSGRKKEQKSSGEIIIGMNNDTQFVSLDESKFETTGLDIISSSSRSGNQTLDASDVSFKVATFKFKKTDAFKGKLKLDRKFLSDVPENVSIEGIVIK